MLTRTVVVIFLSQFLQEVSAPNKNSSTLKAVKRASARLKLLCRDKFLSPTMFVQQNCTMRLRLSLSP